MALWHGTAATMVTPWLVHKAVHARVMDCGQDLPQYVLVCIAQFADCRRQKPNYVSSIQMTQMQPVVLFSMHDPILWTSLEDCL